MSWNRKYRILLLEQLEMHVSAGLPATIALRSFAESQKGRRKADTALAADAVESGQMLSRALSQKFGMSSSVIGLVACGEDSGTLASSLAACRSILERQDELVKKCLSSMAYPAVIGLATIGLTIGLVNGIMPQIIPLLTSLRADLPLLTVIVMSVSKFLMSHGLVLMAGLVALAFVLGWAYRKVLPLRRSAHMLILLVPIVGGVIRKYSFSVFFQSLGAMIEAGIPAHIAYEKAIESIPMDPIRRAMLAKLEALRQGGDWGAIALPDMPGFARPLISAGQASGRLGQSLSKIAALIERELDHSLKRLISLLEPAMMLGMGGMVGSVALSIMLPIYDISKTLQH